jgi:bacteriophage N4 adsorption protein B
MLPFVAQELLLFAGCFYLLLGIDDLLVDLTWLIRGRAKDLDFIPDLVGQPSGKVAVFVAAWNEGDVIGAMISNARRHWGDGNYRIFVGCYPNDLATSEALLDHEDEWVARIIGSNDGPTSKADCLNQIWKALLACEDMSDFKTVLLHDAEDVVHPREIELFGQLGKRYDFIQIPVIPLVDPDSPWVSGHYLDEFAEAHQKELPFRQSLGASLPSAGTGCAISVHALHRIAEQKGGLPFDAASLTEDYELGLSLWQAGCSSRFVRMRDPKDGSLIAIRSYFPDTLTSSIRQKTRWIIGIALAGWDRIGWHGGLSEHWMRWRDRRVLLSSIVMIAGYLGALLAAILLMTNQQLPSSEALRSLLLANAALLLWRLAFRASFTGSQYGLGQGLISIPRALMGNFIAMGASISAACGYVRYLVTGRLKWNKTSHRFPSETVKGGE